MTSDQEHVEVLEELAQPILPDETSLSPAGFRPPSAQPLEAMMRRALASPCGIAARTTVELPKVRQLFFALRVRYPELNPLLFRASPSDAQVFWLVKGGGQDNGGRETS